MQTMKKMTCKQLGGACDHEFWAESFEEMAGLSRDHALGLTGRGDLAHMKAMNDMRIIMENPTAMQEWMEKKRAEFESLPDMDL